MNARSAVEVDALVAAAPVDLARDVRRYVALSLPAIRVDEEARGVRKMMELTVMT